MPGAQVSNQRKRRNSEQSASQHDGALPTVYKRQAALQQAESFVNVHKRQKPNPDPEAQFSPSFWDNLSSIELTHRALRELDRRNAEATQTPGRPFIPPISTALAEPSHSSQPLTSPADYVRLCGSAHLKHLKNTARRGGPDMSDIKDLPRPPIFLKPTTASSRSTHRAPKRLSVHQSIEPPTTTTSKSKSSGPYNRNFQQHLIDSGIYPRLHTFSDGRRPAKPDNWEEIHRRLKRPRASLSPSRFPEEAHEKFVQANADARKEHQVMRWVIPIIEGDIGDAKCASGTIPFTNLDCLTDDKLVPGNPDIFYGARAEDLDRRVRDQLDGHLIPSTQKDLPIASNFFLEVKGPSGTSMVADLQASYYGASGARGMRSLQSYVEEELVSDNSAFVISANYYSGFLRLFTVHSVQDGSPASRPQYFMHPIAGWDMMSDPEQFRTGASAYRNARDWAKEQRDEAIKRANEKVNANGVGKGSMSTSLAQETGGRIGSLQTSMTVPDHAPSSSVMNDSTTSDTPSGEFPSSNPNQFQQESPSRGPPVNQSQPLIKDPTNIPESLQPQRKQPKRRNVDNSDLELDLAGQFAQQQPKSPRLSLEVELHNLEQQITC